MNWLVRAVIRLLPAAWRQTVLDDLAEEAAASGRQGWTGAVWCAWQAGKMAFPLRRVVTGDVLMSDIRYAVRSLLRARWFTVGAVVTFALGIGVNLAVFSAVDRMLFRSLPYGQANRLILLRDCSVVTGECAGSFPSAVAYAAQGHMRTISEIGVAGFSRTYPIVPDAADDNVLALVSVSPNLLDVLQVTIARGHPLSETERISKQHVAWLRDETWRVRFGADLTAIGRTIGEGSRSATIIGVLPKGFLPPAYAAFNPKWDGLVVNYDDWSMIAPLGRMLVPVARLRDGFALAAAQTEVGELARKMGEGPEKPAQFRTTMQVDPLERGLFSRYRRYLQLVSVAAAMIFLVTCANLAALLVARGRSREQQAAIRTALGASRARLIGASMIEASILCCAGTIVSLGVLEGSATVLRKLLPPIFSSNTESVWDLRVMVFAAVVSVCSAVIIGVLPGWRMSRLDVLTMLRKSVQTRRDSRLTSGRALLGVEAAFGCVLVLGALLTLQSLFRLLNDDVGAVPVGLYTVTAGSKVRFDPPQQLERYARMLEVVRQMPGVRAAGGSDSIVVRGDVPVRGFASNVAGARYRITAGYLEALGVRLLAGRTISSTDVSGSANVAVVSRSGAAALWPDLTPPALLGHTWQAEGEPAREIVGVVDDVKSYYGDQRSRLAAVYLPAGIEASKFTAFVVRVEAGVSFDARALHDRLKEELGELRVSTSYVPDQWDVYVRDPRFRAVLLSTLAVTGLILTVAGLFALASYEVGRRRAEMAIRLALGSTPGAVAREIVRDVCAPVVMGSGVGLVVGYWSVRFAQEFLFGVDGHDVWNYLAVGGIVVMSALLASWLPARRAARIQPSLILKSG